MCKDAWCIKLFLLICENSLRKQAWWCLQGFLSCAINTKSKKPNRQMTFSKWNIYIWVKPVWSMLFCSLDCNEQSRALVSALLIKGQALNIYSINHISPQCWPNTNLYWTEQCEEHVSSWPHSGPGSSPPEGVGTGRSVSCPAGRSGVLPGHSLNSEGTDEILWRKTRHTKAFHTVPKQNQANSPTSCDLVIVILQHWLQLPVFRLHVSTCFQSCIFLFLWIRAQQLI